MSSSLSQRPGDPNGPAPLSGVALPWRGPVTAGGETVINTPRRDVVDDSATVTPLNSDLLGRIFPLAAEIARQGEDSENVAGVRIGHFTLERRIGVGGMGAVFLAWDDRLHRRVAVKILSPSQTTDPMAIARFQNEARATAQLDHENIARIYYYGEEQGLHYIAYEYVTGQNLRDIIRSRGRLDPAEAVNITIQLAGALNHTSAAGVVHRDIKPSNILLTPAGRAKLVDLGLARQEGLQASQELTVAGTTLGTFDYISPEQARDPRSVDVRSDIYSLGCTLYHTLTGEPPYPEGTVLQKLLEHQANDPPDPARKNRRVPPALSAVVRKMMASDPRRRYSSPDELIRDLLVVARQLGLRAMTGEGLIYRTEPTGGDFWRQNAGWIATASALVVLVLFVQRYPDLARPFAQVPSTAAVRPSNTGDPSLTNGAPAVALTGPLQSTQQTAALPPNVEVRDPRIPDAVDEGVTQSPAIVPMPTPETGSIAATARLIPDPKPATSSELPFDNPQLAPLLSNVLNNVPEPGPLPSLEPQQPSTKSSPAEGVPNGASPGPVVSSSGNGASLKPTPLQLPPQAEVKPSIVVLDATSSRTTPRSYPSLEAACAEAKESSVIELRYNGRWGTVERPIRLSNKRLTIRAGQDFQPVVEFAPRGLPSEASESRMFTVAGGTLEIRNVAFQLNLTDTLSADPWAVFSLQRAERLDLRSVQVTVINPGSRNAAVIEYTPPPGQVLSTMDMKNMGTLSSGTDVSVARSLIRGGAEFAHVRDTTPLRLNVSDSAIATERVLLHVIGPMDAAPANAEVRLDLSNSTCLLGGGMVLAQAFDDYSSRLLPLQVTTRNNLIGVRGPQPLFEFRCVADPNELKQQFTFTGERNYYDDLRDFWQITAPLGERSPVRMDFSEWRQFWGGGELNGSQNLPLFWSGRSYSGALAEISISDLRSDEDAENPLGLNVGAPLDDLPTMKSAALVAP